RSVTKRTDRPGVQAPAEGKRFQRRNDLPSPNGRIGVPSAEGKRFKRRNGRPSPNGRIGVPSRTLSGRHVEAVFVGANQSPIFAVRLQGDADDLLFDAEKLDDNVPADFSWQDQ